MRRLFVTERDLNIQLKDNYTSASVNNASIALLSATFAIKYFNLWEDAFFNLFSQATGKVEKQIVFNAGFWTPKQFRDTFNAQAHGCAALDDLTNGKMQLKIVGGWKISISDGIPQLIGIRYDPSKTKYLKDGVHYMTPNFYPVREVRLYCDQLDEANNYLNETPSKLLAAFTLPSTYEFNTCHHASFDNPIYLPLKPNTYELSFRMTDEHHPEKSLSLGNIRLELLLKEKENGQQQIIPASAY